MGTYYNNIKKIIIYIETYSGDKNICFSFIEYNKNEICSCNLIYTKKNFDSKFCSNKLLFFSIFITIYFSISFVSLCLNIKVVFI